MIYFGVSVSLRQMYSGRLSGVIRQKFDMYIVMNISPLVDSTLLKNTLDTIMLAVGVATFTG